MPQGYGQPVQNTRPNPYRLRQDLGYVPPRTATGKTSSSGSGDPAPGGGGGVTVSDGPNPVVTSTRVQVVNEPNATRTLTVDDLYVLINCTNAAGCVITIPTDVTLAWDGAVTPIFAFHQDQGAGQISIPGGGGVTVNTLSIYKKKSFGPAAILQLAEIAPNVYTLFGAQEPV